MLLGRKGIDNRFNLTVLAILAVSGNITAFSIVFKETDHY